MTDKLISIIINNYNYGRFLSQAIDSALNQNYPYIEVIVVDDGSTDDSQDIITAYGNRIIPVLKKNGGQASACNSGFSISQGNFVIFLDADDFLLPSAAESILPLFNDPEVIKVNWPLHMVDENSQKTGGIIPRHTLIEGSHLDFVIKKGPRPLGSPPMSGNCWRRSFLEKILPIQEWGDKHGADAYLNTLALIYGCIAKVSVPQSRYRLHPSNFSQKLQNNVRFQTERDIRRYTIKCDLLKKHLSSMSIEPTCEEWDEPLVYMKSIITLPDELSKYVPSNESLILVDQNMLGADFFPQHKTFPFMEHDGVFAGFPEDDKSAIQELERLRNQGANYILFTPTTFWCLDYYTGFNKYLRTMYDSIHESKNMVVFNINNITKV